MPIYSSTGSLNQFFLVGKESNNKAHIQKACNQTLHSGTDHLGSSWSILVAKNLSNGTIGINW